MATYTETFTGTAFAQMPSVDANWVRVRGAVDSFRLAGNGIEGVLGNVDTGSVTQVYRYEGLSTSATNSEVYADIVNVVDRTSDNSWQALVLRVSADGNTRYECRLRNSGGNYEISVLKHNAGETTLRAYGTADFSPPCVVTFRAVGTSLSVLVDGSELWSGTDSDISSGGIGVSCLGDSGSAGNNTALDNLVMNDAYAGSLTDPQMILDIAHV